MSDGSQKSKQARPSLDDLKRKSVRGGLITIPSKFVTISLQLASTVILARILTPEDFGLVAMVVSVTAFAGLFRDLGLSSAAIQKQDLNIYQHSNLFWINVALGIFLTLVVSSLSPIVAMFYERPELKSATICISFVFLAGSLGAQHRVALTKQMDFLRIELSAISGSILGFIVSVILAKNSFGFWALIWGVLASQTWTSLALITFSPLKIRGYSSTTRMDSILKFGVHVTLFEFFNYLHRNFDNILIGRIWGPQSLGIYSRAYQMLMLPIQALRGPINAVAFPALSALDSKSIEYRIYYRRIAGILALASMPLTGFLFLVSDPLILLALGPGWDSVVPIFTILAVSAFIQPVASLRGLVLLSSGQGRKYSIWGLVNTIFVAIAFLLAIRWGGKGIAISYAIVNYLLLFPSLKFCFENTSIRISDFVVSVARPAAITIACVAILCVVFPVFENGSPVIVVGINLVTFCIMFIAIFILIPGGKSQIWSVVDLLRGAISGRRHSR